MWSKKKRFYQWEADGLLAREECCQQTCEVTLAQFNGLAANGQILETQMPLTVHCVTLFSPDHSKLMVPGQPRHLNRGADEARMGCWGEGRTF